MHIYVIICVTFLGVTSSFIETCTSRYIQVHHVHPGTFRYIQVGLHSGDTSMRTQPAVPVVFVLDYYCGAASVVVMVKLIYCPRQKGKVDGDGCWGGGGGGGDYERGGGGRIRL